MSGLRQRMPQSWLRGCAVLPWMPCRSLSQSNVVVLAWQVVEGVVREVHVAMLPCGFGQHFTERVLEPGMQCSSRRITHDAHHHLLMMPSFAYSGHMPPTYSQLAATRPSRSGRPL